MKKIVRCLDSALEFVFPSTIYCISCGSIIDKSRPYGICDNCMSLYSFATERTCIRCGKPLADDNRQDICRLCMTKKFSFSKGYSCVRYGLHEKKPLMQLKYGEKPYVAKFLGKLMAERLAVSNAEFDIIVPVPVHSSKLFTRGYNQAMCLAQEISESSGKPLADVLIRTRASRPMSRLNLLDRLENVTGIFALREDAGSLIAGKNVLLVDDIMTTGSTLEDCTRRLLSGGACRVETVVFAAGADGKQNKED
ncbi:MAG: ComF family protein [Clostridia bacterium]|nr:ComF family protein [Clostridia bacterium]